MSKQITTTENIPATTWPAPSWANGHLEIDGGLSWYFTPPTTVAPTEGAEPIDVSVERRDLMTVDEGRVAVAPGELRIVVDGEPFTPDAVSDLIQALTEILDAIEAGA